MKSLKNKIEHNCIVHFIDMHLNKMEKNIFDDIYNILIKNVKDKNIAKLIISYANIKYTDINKLKKRRLTNLKFQT